MGTGAAWPRSALREVPFRHADAVEEDHEGGYTNGALGSRTGAARRTLSASSGSASEASRGDEHTLSGRSRHALYCGADSRSELI